MMLSSVTSEPAYLLNVPNRLLSSISQLPLSVVNPSPTCWHQIQNQQIYLQKLMRPNIKIYCLCTVFNWDTRQIIPVNYCVVVPQQILTGHSTVMPSSIMQWINKKKENHNQGVMFSLVSVCLLVFQQDFNDLVAGWVSARNRLSFDIDPDKGTEPEHLFLPFLKHYTIQWGTFF